MSNMKATNMIQSVLLGLLVGLVLAQIFIVAKYHYLDYSQAKAERAEEARRIAQEQDIERNCEWVAVRLNEMVISAERRAKPGVSREQGLKTCGKNAFNRGGEVRVEGKPGLALGRGSVAVAPEQD